jgi:hypothetical protein
MFEINAANHPQREAIQALILHYENARMDGLCHEGAWEVALGAVSDANLPLDVIQKLEALLR